MTDDKMADDRRSVGLTRLHGDDVFAVKISSDFAALRGREGATATTTAIEHGCDDGENKMTNANERQQIVELLEMIDFMMQIFDIIMQFAFGKS